MQTIKNYKTFMDSVHGYISVPNYFVENLIDTDYFQRLRNVDQTGTRILYPCVKHDRFSHSIGVFYLGSKAVQSVIESFINDCNYKIDNEDDIKELERNRILFLIACLLHDIGHAPFSHSLENQMLKNSLISFNGEKKEIAESLCNKMVEFETKYVSTFSDLTFNENLTSGIIKNKGASHEQIGSHLIFEDFFRKKIKSIFIELAKNSYQYFNNKKIDFEEAKVDSNSEIVFNDDICFIARMIMGIKYESFEKKRQIRNCFIELLNSENFDVDKLDYIIRDTKMSGISNVDLDVERLLKSVCINISTRYFRKEFNNKLISEDITLINVKNNTQDNTLSIKGRVKGSVLLYPGAVVEINENSLFGKIKGKIILEDINIGVFDDKTKITVDSKAIKSINSLNYPDKVKIIKGNDKEETNVYIIENAKTVNTFSFKVIEDTELHFNGECEFVIKGRFKSESAITIFEKSTFTGNIDEMEIIGDILNTEFTENKIINSECYNIYRICFKKQAVNVIANVLKARNFLYLWVYAHHKVVYYANFLIPVIAQEIFKMIKSDNSFPEWSLSYENIKYLDDCYIWTLMRHILYSNEKNVNNLSISPVVKELIEEILNRKYKNSLYKSLVEHDLFFESFTVEEKNQLIEKISQLIDLNKPYIKNRDKHIEVGYFKKSELNEINNILEKKYERKFKVTEMIYVVANYKLKQLQPLNVHIDMGNQKYVPISKIPLLEIDSIKENKVKNNYFYLYYNIENKDNETIVASDIKKAILKYFSTLIIDNKALNIQ